MQYDWLRGETVLRDDYAPESAPRDVSISRDLK